MVLVQRSPSMVITDIRFLLIENSSDLRFKARCAVEFDANYVIRDMKIIKGYGGLFVAMPSRKITDACYHCNGKNHLKAKFCNECGKFLRRGRVKSDGETKQRLYVDIA